MVINPSRVPPTKVLSTIRHLVDTLHIILKILRMAITGLLLNYPRNSILLQITILEVAKDYLRLRTTINSSREIIIVECTPEITICIDTQ